MRAMDREEERARARARERERERERESLEEHFKDMRQRETNFCDPGNH